MATIVVNNTLDENDGSIVDGDVSLRDAIAYADSQAGADTITFASGPGEAFEGGGTIRLDAALGELVIASDVTIDGDLDDDGAPDVTITGDTLGDDALTTDPLRNTITNARDNANMADNVRVLNVTAGSSTLHGLVVTGGRSMEHNGAGVSVANSAALMVRNSCVSGNLGPGGEGSGGGGIHNDGTLMLVESTVSGNQTPFMSGVGGGIYNHGNLMLSNTTVSDNTEGGGIFNTGTATITDAIVSGNSGRLVAGGIANGGILTLTDTTVSGNRSGDDTEAGEGGGIANSGTATLINTTVSGNSGGFLTDGGGIANRGTLTLTDAMVSGNSAGSYGHGGGIHNTRTATLTNTTVSGNSVGEYSSGGGIYNKGMATLTLANTIALGNRAPDGPEIEGEFIETGPNLIGGSAGDVFDAIDPDTGGGLLADNGGPVATIALKNDPSNPALDAGQDNRLDESVVRIDLNGDGDTTDVIDTDARGSGFERFVDLPGIANNGTNTVDLGAFELQADEFSEVDCVEVRFVSESAGYRSTYGWYDTGTLEARILVANVDTATNPGLETFAAGLPLSPTDLETLGFFLIPDGYRQNADPGEPFADGDGTDLDLEVFDDGGVWKVRDTDSGYVFEGTGNPAYFTDPGINPGGLDHVMETGDLFADGSVTHAWEDLPDLGDADFDDVVFEVETQYTVEVSFASEDAGYRSTYGWYHTETGKAEILVANVDTATNPDLANFTATLSLTADEIQHLGFFLIPDGYEQISDPGGPWADGDGTDLDLEVFEANGVWQVRDTDTGSIFQGLGAPVYFTEADKNPAGNDHVMEEGDLMADGAVTHNWEDLPGLGDEDFNDVVFDVSLGCGPGEVDIAGSGSDALIV